MQKLIKGLHDFQRNVFPHQREFFERLAEGQSPDVLFITCSDSRINPNLLTQTEPGELFIVRNAGNLVPAHGPVAGGEAATIEFAVAALHIRDIIVCGHSGCGAVDALLNPDSVARLPAVASWLHHAEATRRILQDRYSDLTGEALHNVAVQENVLVQLEHLRTLPSVASALAAGQLRLHGWVYKIDTGQVFAFSAEHQEFVPAAEVRVPAVSGRRRAVGSI